MNSSDTFDAVDSFYLSMPVPATRSVGAPTAADVCAGWQKIRPLVAWILPFVPSRWRAIITPAVTLLDQFCQAPQP